MSENVPAEQINDLIIESMQDIKAKNIVLLDLRPLGDSPTDFFIICEGESDVQVKSIAQNVRKRLKLELGEIASHVEGMQRSRWVLLDYLNVVVHVFHPEARAYYELEEMWSDAEVRIYQDL